MHRLAATPGGWNPDTEGVIFLEQTPAPIVVLSAADTDIQTIANALPRLPQDFPALRVANLLNLQQQLTIDTYAESVLEQAQVIVIRLLGGRAYWAYGLEVVKQTVQQTGATLFVLPGDDRPDPDLISHSTAPLSAVNQLWQYFNEGGIENLTHALQFVATLTLNKNYPIHPPTPIPKIGLYPWPHPQSPTNPTAALLFYRAHYLAGNTQPIDALCQALAERQLNPLPIFVSSLRDRDVQTELLEWLRPKQGNLAQILLNTTSFSLARLDSETPQLELWETLDIPVLQVILSGGTEQQWRSQLRGLSPRDVAMNVALPEVDGRIIGRAISFKTVQEQHPSLETDVVRYEAVSDRVQFTADLAANWVRLRQTPVGDRHIALILANYPTRDGRLANGVGLDTPASCVEMLKALQQAGYTVDEIPETGDELIQWLTSTPTNDPESHFRPAAQTLSPDAYQSYFNTLPAPVRSGILDRWPQLPDQPILIPGLQLGNIFVGIQPARGYDLDPSLNYHAPDLEPPHTYLAFYHWVRSHFNAQAIVHVGKHGNLEWLPGKSVALSEGCYPEVALGPLPHLYPFIVNDPGEGSQAKRRAQAVIIDHLTPPLTRAELYGPLQQLEALIDEYYEAQTLDPSRLGMIGDRIQTLIAQEDLSEELLAPPGTGVAFGKPIQVNSQTASTECYAPTPPTLTDLLTNADTYLCGLKEAQIRDGLHIFGQCPHDRQLRDLIIAIARHPAPGRLGLTRAIAQSWNLDFDPLTTDPGTPWEKIAPNSPAIPQARHWRTVGDAIEALEQEAAHLVETILSNDPSIPYGRSIRQTNPGEVTSCIDRMLHPYPPTLQAELAWIRDRLLPALLATSQEVTHLLHGLEGGYVPSGASGAPTRGRPEVLPTGRNFYSVDIRAIPTESAWDVGRKAAEALIERYTQEQGEYPKTLGLSIWGTSTMRTGGDDLAEALALLGVRPVWDGPSRRVVDFEILPLSLLGRPRVDVTLRISGFFRDAFPNLIDLFHQAVTAVAALEEPDEQNPLAARVRQEAEEWQAKGLSAEQAVGRSLYRIFGSKPGAYGAGLQGLIEAQNWTTDEDLARAYINWSSYAYTSQGEGRSAPEAFEQRLKTLQIVLHNQDNREHDLLDSDDYYQFQGGLTAAVRVLQGKNPQTYFGDHSLPENPRIRTLKEEITRVYRSRVINPKWIAGVMRHGYKGAFEMAATVDYLFAYSATAQCVPNYVYEGVAKAYLLDSEVQSFVHQKNPWALRDMAERMLEAHQRGLWQGADIEILEELRAIAHQAEGAIEMRL